VLCVTKYFRVDNNWPIDCVSELLSLTDTELPSADGQSSEVFHTITTWKPLGCVMRWRHAERRTKLGTLSSVDKETKRPGQGRVSETV